MLSEFQRYHGVVLTRLVHSSPKAITIRTYSSPSNASYIIDGKVGLYVKHSTQRLPPWPFTFQKRHRDEILEMHNQLADVFIVFVCHTDGIVCLRFRELEGIVDMRHADAEWVRISRRRGEMYTVIGKQGRLERKIGDSDFPRRLIEGLEKNGEFPGLPGVGPYDKL